MKKHLLFVLGLSLVAGSLTACHDDDDDDSASDYVLDYTTAAVGSSIVSNISSYAGCYVYTICDANTYTDLYTFSTASSFDDITDENGYLDASLAYNNWYGGFTPTAVAANDEDDPYTPISGAYHSGTGALLVNQGSVCRSVFSKHIAADISTLSSYLLLDGLKGFYVQPTYYYSLLNDSSTLAEYSIEQLPANHKIQLCVYGYLKDSFSFNSFKNFLSSLKNSVAETGSGVLSSSVIDLASADENGNVTVLEDWEYADLSDLNDYCMYEVYIRVVGSDGKTSSSTYTLPDELNVVLIDDVTFAAKDNILSKLSN